MILRSVFAGGRSCSSVVSSGSRQQQQWQCQRQRQRLSSTRPEAQLNLRPAETNEFVRCSLVAEGIVSYTIPQGDRFSSTVDLSDKIYDGGRDDSTLHDGLGQLTDGVEGGDNFKAEYSKYGKGYEWVGWRNDSAHSNPLEMVFEFDTVRNFSAAYFYCNNQHTKDVSLFNSAKFWFSIGGQWYVEEPLVFKNMHNPLPEKARNVTIRLHHKVGKFVKVQLSYRSGWILLSEVSFISAPANGTFVPEEEPIAPPVGEC